MAGRTSAVKKDGVGAKEKISTTQPQPLKLLESHLPKVDQLIHERLRLGIVSALAVNECLSFKELRESLQTTDGNLSVHARKLEEAGYIVCTKSFDGRTPRTEYRLAATGKKMLEKYLDHMEALIQAMRRK